MATSDFKSAASSTLRDTSKMGEKIIDEAGPRVRETLEQVSDSASDLYSRANDWLDEGNNRNYAFLALAASAGVIGFLVGRGIRSQQSEF